MPFYKWIIDANENSFVELREADVNAIANKRLVNTIQHLAQLVIIANDIFNAIDRDCRNIFERTNSLRIKIQSCQDIVENFNAKTVKVPVSSLSSCQAPLFRSKDDTTGKIFSTVPRPPEVERLRQLASGPTPPAVIPSYEITDGEPASTHIYCQPLPVKSSNKSNKKISLVSPEIMAPTTKVSSSMVPIDVSGQPFSRMSTFRRSLIHVDFLIRRKKKKRRNSVAEGELKDVLHNILNEEHTLMPVFEGKSPKDEIDYYSKLSRENDVTEEKNNNSKEACIETDFEKNAKMNNNSENKINGSDRGSFGNHKNSDVKKSSTVNKRKSIGHIPISTISAAMSVAVEMRQLNGKNDHNSSHPEKLPRCKEEAETNDSFCNRLKDISNNMMILRSHPHEIKESEISSGTSSDNNGTHDDATSTESDIFFISSDESDEDSCDVIEPNYGSSLSLSTGSNGSLNSLLSQTGTEMTSSTGTLTSIELPMPPTTTSVPQSDAECTFLKQEEKSVTPIASAKPSKKTKATQKSIKTEKCDTRKSSAESSKSIFTSLVNMKSRTKEQNKNNKLNKIQNKPLINMYGNCSPKNCKQLPFFVKENISPEIQIKPRNNMQSFFPQENVNEQNSDHANQFEFHANPSVRQQNTCIKTTEAQIEVPFKYSHKVTVTPIQRKTMSEGNNSIILHKQSLFKCNEDQKQNTNDIVFHQKSDRSHLKDSKKEIVLTRQQHKPQRPITLQNEKTKSAARVLLDPEGRVIHSTKSLDRKPYHSHSAGIHSTRINNQSEYSVNQGEIINSNSKIHAVGPGQNSNFEIQNGTTHFNCKQHELSSNSSRRLINSPITTMPGMNYSLDIPKKAEIRPNCTASVKHSLSEVFSSNTLIDNLSTTPVLPHSENRSREFLSHSSSIKRHHQSFKAIADSKFHQSIPFVISPDPNISGLPSSETMLTQHNVNLHSMNMEKISKMQTVNNCTNLLEDSQATQRSPMRDDSHKPQQNTMSTEDLFAVIHNCKKRMNIKTNSDISLASSSSRSSSSSCFRPVSSKGGLAETGFLSPRNPSANFDHSRDRRSWADFRPINGTPERKSLASDRLGPTKPTSMHDFKMLLLQTRTSSQSLGPRKSAVEMLKVPSNQNKDNTYSTSVNSSPQSPMSLSLQNSPSSEFIIYSGHSTVPFKRNNRTRSSLQSRYTMYPPIFEDCSEDMENNRDNQQNFSSKAMTDRDCVNKNTQLHYNENSNCENSIQNLRLWL